MTLLEIIKEGGETVIQAIEGAFTTVEGEIAAVLSKGGAAIAATIKAQLPTVTSDTVNFIEQSALAAVSAAAEMPGDGTVKMTAALASFAASIATKGLIFAENEARTFLENALLSYKASTPAAVPTATTPAPAAADAIAHQ